MYNLQFNAFSKIPLIKNIENLIGFILIYFTFLFYDNIIIIFLIHKIRL